MGVAFGALSGAAGTLGTTSNTDHQTDLFKAYLSKKAKENRAQT